MSSVEDSFAKLELVPFTQLSPAVCSTCTQWEKGNGWRSAYCREKLFLHVAIVAKFLYLNEKTDMYDFPVRDCTHDQEQNGSPYFSFVVYKCKWLSLSQKIVEIQKSCYQGNLTSPFSSLLLISVLLDLSKTKSTIIIIWFLQGPLLTGPELKFDQSDIVGGSLILKISACNPNTKRNQ